MLTARGLSARGRKCAEYKPVLWLPFLTVFSTCKERVSLNRFVFSLNLSERTEK